MNKQRNRNWMNACEKGDRERLGKKMAAFGRRHDMQLWNFVAFGRSSLAG
ncbi:MAG: hypothetical protein HDR00_00110 [Lachnospiraceae bacterium]|nr:hypothetical protein [Lachnospiraceae bacterium]